MSLDEKELPSKEELAVLCHALGLDSGSEPYRNHYMLYEGSDGMPLLRGLEARGLMVSRKYPLADDAVMFHATDTGKEEALKSKLAEGRTRA